MTRSRSTLRGAAAAVALLAVGPARAQTAAAPAQPIQVPLDGATIPKFVDALPTFAGLRVGGPIVGVTMRETTQQVLPASFPATTVWGYQVAGLDAVTGVPVVRAARFPGVTVEARQSVPTVVLYTNALTTPTLQRRLPVDQTVQWADPKNLGCVYQSPVSAECLQPFRGPVPTVVHLHGGEVPPAFDGGPEMWFTNDGRHGSNYSSLARVLPNQALYRYPNAQEATALWFHDHALGTTRLNVYGGIAAFYFLRDGLDTGRRDNPLRLPAEAQEIELALQDRSFDTAGQLLYHDPSQLSAPDLHPWWRPEFFGDVVVVNGKSWPRLEVEPRRYRLRILNGSNARFYNLALARAFTPLDAAAGTGVQVTAPGPTFWKIGTDGGRLDAPVPLASILVAPGERADLLVDFSGLAPGTTLTVVNDANAPYPGGDPVVTATTGQVMQIRVSRPLSSKDRTCDPATGGCVLRPGSPMVRLVDPAGGALAAGVAPSVRRQLILKEIAVDTGPREVVLNNTLWPGVKESTLTSTTQVPIPGSVGLGENWATEAPQVGATELWEVANLTVDAHPIHVHLVQFQVLSRQALDTGEDDLGNPLGYMRDWQAAFPSGAIEEGDGPPGFYGQPNADGAVGGNLPVSGYLLGAARPAEAGEEGWKDTVVMLPGEVTRIAVRFAPQGLAVGHGRPGSNHYPFDPALTDPSARDLFGNPGAAGYVWHCHILEHEDNEMMRPFAMRR